MGGKGQNVGKQTSIYPALIFFSFLFFFNSPSEPVCQHKLLAQAAWLEVKHSRHFFFPFIRRAPYFFISGKEHCFRLHVQGFLVHLGKKDSSRRTPNDIRLYRWPSIARFFSSSSFSPPTVFRFSVSARWPHCDRRRLHSATSSLLCVKYRSLLQRFAGFRAAFTKESSTYPTFLSQKLDEKKKRMQKAKAVIS